MNETNLNAECSQFPLEWEELKLLNMPRIRIFILNLEFLQMRQRRNLDYYLLFFDIMGMI